VGDAVAGSYPRGHVPRSVCDPDPRLVSIDDGGEQLALGAPLVGMVTIELGDEIGFGE
jgi:hypothetical protein